MYAAKVVKGNREWLLPECASVQATRRPGSGPQLQLMNCRVGKSETGAPGSPSGLHLYLAPDGPVISLPEDADAVYVINCDTGVTMDIHRWPTSRAAVAAREA